jgi:putative tricarboxylic transport membrane protein
MVLNDLTDAAAFVFTPEVFPFILLGTLIGMVFGALPGLGGVIAIALLIPFTFGMEPTVAMALFGASMGGVAFGGSVSAILINTPGTAPNAATLFDGHPLAKQGRGAEALGISATASGLGAIFGLIILLLMLPIAKQFITSFQSVEFFWLAIFGLIAIAVISRGNEFKGLISGFLGMMITFIGFDSVTGEMRYVYGTDYLWDGIPLIPAIIGLFAIAEAIKLASKGGSIAGDEIEAAGSVLKGVRSVFQNWRVFLQSSILGVLIGMIPGAGGGVANFLSYIFAVQTSKDNSEFGNGDPRGVIASEASNDSKDGGSLLPTLVLGIPGSATTAVLLGAFILHGLQPGLNMLQENLNVTLILIISLALANVITSTIGLLTTNYLVKITRVPGNILTPMIFVIGIAGAFAIRNNFMDVLLATLFGVVAFGMIVYDFPRVPLVLGLILTPIAEKRFFIALDASSSGFIIFFTRPIALFFVFLIVLSLTLPLVRRYLTVGLGSYVDIDR